MRSWDELKTEAPSPKVDVSLHRRSSNSIELWSAPNVSGLPKTDLSTSSPITSLQGWSVRPFLEIRCLCFEVVAVFWGGGDSFPYFMRVATVTAAAICVNLFRIHNRHDCSVFANPIYCAPEGRVEGCLRRGLSRSVWIYLLSLSLHAGPRHPLWPFLSGGQRRVNSQDSRVPEGYKGFI